MLNKVHNYTSTSFHDVTIKTTPNKLIALARKLDACYGSFNDGLEKTNFDFAFEIEGVGMFTVYDYKEYKSLELDATYVFHIGARDWDVSYKGKQALLEAF
jgi:hypothetical protein